MRSAADLSEFNRRLFSDRVFEARESRLRKAFALLDEEAVRGPALDVAAGSGIASAAMAASGWRVTALDISEDLLAQVR
ncbi:MAG: hypothetical protein QOK40_777, partial [Miltoncostaeaceae bacterium]|nr:hypothetical protein [Miltoncostaeaceae bacterium]